MIMITNDGNYAQNKDNKNYLKKKKYIYIYIYLNDHY